MPLLDEWLSEAETAAEIKVSVRTLRSWRKRGIGPPYAYFGRAIKYNKPTLIEHYRSTQIVPVRKRKRGEPNKAEAAR
jgi:hypothetical protein